MLVWEKHHKHVGYTSGIIQVERVSKLASRPAGRFPRRFAQTRCECGTVQIVHLWDVLSGNKKSCGCAQHKRRFATRQAAIDAFWSRIDRSLGEYGCWPIVTQKKRKTSYKYGSFQHSGFFASEIPSRISWEISIGPIPAGLCVLHRCDVPRCVNPAHLFLGTIKDNGIDCSRKGRARNQHMPKRYGTAKPRILKQEEL